MDSEFHDMESLNIEFTYSDVNCYKQARDSFLKRILLSFPNDRLEALELSFQINSRAQNGPLLYIVLEKLPQDVYIVQKNEVNIVIRSEQELMNQMETILDIVAIVRSWKTTMLLINNIEIGTSTEFGYYINYFCEKHCLHGIDYRRSIAEISRKYIKHKGRSTKGEPNEPGIYLSNKNVREALQKVIDKYVELYGNNKAICSFDVTEYDKVLLIEDSLVVDFRLLPWYWTRKDDASFKDWDNPYIMMQELTHNDLYKFNFADFRRRFVSNQVGIDFYPYHGVHYYNDVIDNYDFINEKLPGLRLQERYDKYQGELYHFIILRMEDLEGKYTYGVGYTKKKTHDFILKLCKELEEKNSRSLQLNGASCLSFTENREFIEAFLSWKGNRKRWRLENKFSYYVEDRRIKNDIEIYTGATEIIDAAKSGRYDRCEYGSYSKPLNRWKSEELVFNITKKLYKDYQVIYQFRPFYLTTEKGSMSYDIYICGLKIAIEYQGKQHFEPVDYFGGADSFIKQLERDELKAKISKENGVRLVYVNYWESITPDLIKQKVEDVYNKKEV